MGAREQHLAAAAADGVLSLTRSTTLVGCKDECAKTASLYYRQIEMSRLSNNRRLLQIGIYHSICAQHLPLSREGTRRIN